MESLAIKEDNHRVIEGEMIEGTMTPSVNQESLSQRCEFQNDGEIVADWLQSKAITTAKAYWSAIKQVWDFSGNLPLVQWTKKLIVGFIVERKAIDKTNTLNKKLSAIRSLLTHCVREDYLERNVAANIAKVRDDKDDKGKQSLAVTERIIGSKEVWMLIDAAATKRDRLALKACYLLGLRAHELSNLHWSDFTRSGEKWKLKVIGKNDKTAFLPVDNGLYEELKSLGTTGYVFQSQKGSKLSKPQLHRILKKAATKAGLNNQISAHWLRHQRCSDLVNSGKYTLSQVQKFMRHSSPTVTSQYIHVCDEIGSDALL